MPKRPNNSHWMVILFLLILHCQMWYSAARVMNFFQRKFLFLDGFENAYDVVLSFTKPEQAISANYLDQQTSEPSQIPLLWT